MTRDEIFLLLEKNQISMRPDDGAALAIIEKYLNAGEADDGGTGDELVALDAAIDEAADAAEEVYRDAGAAADATDEIICRLIDGWNAHAVLRDFAFSYSADERRYVVNSFADMCPKLRTGMSEMSALSGKAGEAVAMLRGCSAQAQTLASELRYAAIAARLCDNAELDAERQALSDETRERALAAEKLAAEMLRVIRALSVTMSAVSAAISQAASALHVDNEDGCASESSKLISPKRAAAALSNAVGALRASWSDARGGGE